MINTSNTVIFFRDQEAIVRGFTEGSGKYAGMLGSFYVEMLDDRTKKPNGKFFQLSGRLSMEFRSQYKFKNGKCIRGPKKDASHVMLGTIVTYEYMTINTKTGIPRQPIFVRIA